MLSAPSACQSNAGGESDVADQPAPTVIGGSFPGTPEPPLKGIANPVMGNTALTKDVTTNLIFIGSLLDPLFVSRFARKSAILVPS
jgi:hypothetical protein